LDYGDEDSGEDVCLRGRPDDNGAARIIDTLKATDIIKTVNDIQDKLEKPVIDPSKIEVGDDAAVDEFK
jgi:hypothetical protein